MNDIMTSPNFSSLGNFAASTGTSWVSQGTVINRPAFFSFFSTESIALFDAGNSMFDALRFAHIAVFVGFCVGSSIPYL